MQESRRSRTSLMRTRGFQALKAEEIDPRFTHRVGRNRVDASPCRDRALYGARADVVADWLNPAAMSNLPHGCYRRNLDPVAELAVGADIDITRARHAMPVSSSESAEKLCRALNRSAVAWRPALLWHYADEVLFQIERGGLPATGIVSTAYAGCRRVKSSAAIFGPRVALANPAGFRDQFAMITPLLGIAKHTESGVEDVMPAQPTRPSHLSNGARLINSAAKQRPRQYVEQQ